MTTATAIATQTFELSTDDLDSVSGGGFWGTVGTIMTARNVAVGVGAAFPGVAFEAGVMVGAGTMMAGAMNIAKHYQ